MYQNSHVVQKEIFFTAVAITETFSPFYNQFFLDFFSSYLQNTSSGEKSWEVLLGHVISELSKGKIYEEEETEELPVVLANFWKIYPACPLEVFLPRCYNDFSLILLKTCSTALYFLDQSITLGDSLPLQMPLLLLIISDVVSATLRKLLTNTSYNYRF